MSISLRSNPAAVRRPAVTSSESVLIRKRAEAILWIRTQMARHGLSYQHLLDGYCFVPPTEAPAPSARYRSADGKTWDGEGGLPDWLQRAVNAGQSKEFYRVG